MNHIPSEMKSFLDGLAFSGFLATLVDSLPTVLVALTIAYTAIRIYETDTVQRLLGRKKP